MEPKFVFKLNTKILDMKIVKIEILSLENKRIELKFAFIHKPKVSKPRSKVLSQKKILTTLVKN